MQKTIRIDIQKIMAEVMTDFRPDLEYLKDNYVWCSAHGTSLEAEY